MGVHRDERPQLFHHLERASFLEAFHQKFHRTVTIWTLIRQELERILIKLSQTPCGAACARNTSASRRSVLSCPPIVLATTCRTPPAALLLPVLLMRPTSVISVTMRTHVRQCDPSLPLDWNDDPPQEVRALLQDHLRNGLSILVSLLHLSVAVSHFHTCPKAEPVIVQAFRPVARFSCFTRLTHEVAIESQVPHFSQELELLLV